MQPFAHEKKSLFCGMKAFKTRVNLIFITGILINPICVLEVHAAVCCAHTEQRKSQLQELKSLTHAGFEVVLLIMYYMLRACI